MKIIIALPLLSYNDAICNDVRQQAKLLKKAGFDTVIYASESKQNLTQHCIMIVKQEFNNRSYTQIMGQIPKTRHEKEALTL